MSYVNNKKNRNSKFQGEKQFFGEKKSIFLNLILIIAINVNIKDKARSRYIVNEVQLGIDNSLKFKLFYLRLNKVRLRITFIDSVSKISQIRGRLMRAVLRIRIRTDPHLKSPPGSGSRR